jgi:hypothetical protein
MAPNTPVKQGSEDEPPKLYVVVIGAKPGLYATWSANFLLFPPFSVSHFFNFNFAQMILVHSKNKNDFFFARYNASFF